MWFFILKCANRAKVNRFWARTHILRSAQTVVFERPSLEGFQSVFVEVHF